MVSRNRRRWLLGLFAVMVTTVACGVYFRLAAVPVRALDEAWYHNEFQQSRPFDSKTRAEFRWTIVRAEIDHLVAPAPPAHRILEFVDVFRDGEERVFLRFWGEMHIMVVYCWSARDRKLLWKAIEYHSA